MKPRIAGLTKDTSFCSFIAGTSFITLPTWVLGFARARITFNVTTKQDITLGESNIVQCNQEASTVEYKHLHDHVHIHNDDESLTSHSL